MKSKLLGLIACMAVLNAAPARAVTVTSGDSVTVSLGALPVNLYSKVDVFLSFGASDLFGPSESFSGQLFDALDSLISTTSVSSGASSETSVGFGLSG